MQPSTNRPLGPSRRIRECSEFTCRRVAGAGRGTVYGWLMVSHVHCSHTHGSGCCGGRWPSACPESVRRFRREPLEANHRLANDFQFPRDSRLHHGIGKTSVEIGSRDEVGCLAGRLVETRQAYLEVMLHTRARGARRSLMPASRHLLSGRPEIRSTSRPKAVVKSSWNPKCRSKMPRARGDTSSTRQSTSLVSGSKSVSRAAEPKTSSRAMP